MKKNQSERLGRKWSAHRLGSSHKAMRLQRGTPEQETTTSQYVFEISGEFANIDDELSPLYDASGNIYGFKLPDGRECDLAICLRVEDKKGDEKWIVSEKEMMELGLDGLIYDRAEFSVNDEYDNGK